MKNQLTICLITDLRLPHFAAAEIQLHEGYEPKIGDRLCVVAETAERLAPVQGYAPGIPWSMHMEAYDVYCKRYGKQPALIDLEGRNCRGGFGTNELDMFIPGWRERLSEIVSLKARVAELEEKLRQLSPGGE